MDRKDINYYKALSKVNVSLLNSESFEKALYNGIKAIVENGLSDCAIVWKKEKEKGDEETLSPYCYFCPSGFSSASYSYSEGIAAGCYSTGSEELITDFKESMDPKLCEILNNVNIQSVVCVPLNLADDFSGCIELIKGRESGNFTSQSVEFLKVFSEFLQTEYKCEEERKYEDKKGQIILSVNDVYKSFISGESELHVLKGISFDVHEGEFLCLLGESGCGKSLTLNIIGGLINADSGSIKFMDTELTSLSEEELTKYRKDYIGFVFQSYNLMPSITAAQNLDLIAEIVDSPMDTKEALSLVGMADRMDYYPSQLSGGQQQRVSIARALVKNPKLILADEPTAALDHNTGLEVLSVFERLKKHASVIMVTHNERITQMADRVIRIKDGKAYEVTINPHPTPAKELDW